MFTVFYKIVNSSDPEVDHTKSKPISGSLHTYVDLVSKRVGAPAARVGGSHVNFMYYIVLYCIVYCIVLYIYITIFSSFELKTQDFLQFYPELTQDPDCDDPSTPRAKPTRRRLLEF